MRASERERLEKRKMYQQEKAVKAALVLGEPNGCYDNAMRAVWQFPERLKYVEGFEISDGCTCEDCGNCGQLRFNHHAQVLDTVTGIVHEVTPGHRDGLKYIYRSFWRHELGVAGPTNDPMMLLYDPTPNSIQNYDPSRYNDTYTQLTLQAQHDLLRENGYDVELWAVRHCTCITDYCDTCHCGMAKLVEAGRAEEYEERPIDMSTENMSLTSYFRDEGDAGFERYKELNDGWGYEWRLAKRSIGFADVRPLPDTAPIALHLAA